MGAWQLTVLPAAQACRGTNGVRSPSCEYRRLLNYSYVKRAGTVQPCLFCKFPLHFSYRLAESNAFSKLFLLTQLDFCGNLSQRLIYNIFINDSARPIRTPEHFYNFQSLHQQAQTRPSRKGWSGSGCCVAILLPNPAPYLENRMTVCIGYTAKTPVEAGKRRRKGGKSIQRERCTQLVKMAAVSFQLTFNLRKCQRI